MGLITGRNNVRKHVWCKKEICDYRLYRWWYFWKENSWILRKDTGACFYSIAYKSECGVLNLIVFPTTEYTVSNLMVFGLLIPSPKSALILCCSFFYSWRNHVTLTHTRLWHIEWIWMVFNISFKPKSWKKKRKKYEIHQPIGMLNITVRSDVIQLYFLVPNDSIALKPFRSHLYSVFACLKFNKLWALFFHSPTVSAHWIQYACSMFVYAIFDSIGIVNPIVNLVCKWKWT